jgi:hypothetical protein
VLRKREFWSSAKSGLGLEFILDNPWIVKDDTNVTSIVNRCKKATIFIFVDHTGDMHLGYLD